MTKLRLVSVFSFVEKHIFYHFVCEKHNTNCVVFFTHKKIKNVFFKIKKRWWVWSSTGQKDTRRCRKRGMNAERSCESVEGRGTGRIAAWAPTTDSCTNLKVILRVKKVDQKRSAKYHSPYMTGY